MIGTFLARHQVLGLNRRTLLMERENPRTAVQLANDKVGTKAALAAAGVPVVPTLAVIRDRGELAELDWDRLPDAWVLKPNRGRQGAGILLVAGRDGEGWRSASGRHIEQSDLVAHAHTVLDGEHSAGELERDQALLEPLILPYAAVAAPVPFGLPDIRVICHHDEPVMAMMRLPTAASKGRANLHQGAIGAALDLASGQVTRALLNRTTITHHPDTGHPLLGLVVPEWPVVLAAARRCGSAIGLGYVGADLVVARGHGPLVMEVNARPGLEIQNVNGRGLCPRLRLPADGLCERDHVRGLWHDLRRGHAPGRAW